MPEVHIAATTDIETCRCLRRIVFINEQGVSELDELDDLDDQAIHLLAKVDGKPMGTARLIVLGDIGKIGRVCVLKEARGIGLGTALIREAMAFFYATPSVTQAKLGSQIHAIGFYERLGFTTTGPQYDDAGIPHRHMVLSLNKK